MSDKQVEVADQTWTSPALRPAQPAAVGWKNAPRVPAVKPAAKPKTKLVGDALIAEKTLAKIEQGLSKRKR